MSSALAAPQGASTQCLRLDHMRHLGRSAQQRAPGSPLAHLRDVLHGLDGHAARLGGLVPERFVRKLGGGVEQRLLLRREAALVCQQVGIPAARARLSLGQRNHSMHDCMRFLNISSPLGSTPEVHLETVRTGREIWASWCSPPACTAPAG